MNGSVETVADDIRFSRKERTPVGGRVGALCVLMLFCAAGLGLVRVWLPEQVVQMDVAQEAVQVSGDVPSPGMYLVSPPLHVHVALEAAGIDDLSGMPDAVVEPGTRIVVEGRSYRLESMERPLVVGFPSHSIRLTKPHWSPSQESVPPKRQPSMRSGRVVATFKV